MAMFNSKLCFISHESMGESSIHPAFRNVTGLPNFSWTHLATGASEYLATKNQSMAGAVHGWKKKWEK